jgi:hypothetical protein
MRDEPSEYHTVSRKDSTSLVTRATAIGREPFYRAHYLPLADKRPR